MNKRFIFRGMEHSDTIVAAANKKLTKIESFLLKHDKSPISLDIYIEYHPNHAHNRVELKIKTPSFDTVVHEDGNDIYLLLNSIADKAFRELTREKERQLDKQKTGKQRVMEPRKPEDEEGDEFEDDEDWDEEE